INELAASDTADKEKTVTDPIINRVHEAKRSLKIDYILEDSAYIIDETLNGTNRIKEIVQDLRGFSRASLETSIADINKGIESVINIIWNEIKYKSVLIKELGDLPLTRCNQGQLNQVFLNLLLNAAQAIEKQGEIIIKTWVEGNNILISVADNGPGIPPEIQNRIFEPFFTTKEVGKGTGLGLSVSYDIVKKHNGTIEVESTQGEGTTFTVKLPIVGE
ncbi:MAG: ATP-binding protein, partial [Bacillota bacterium]